MRTYILIGLSFIIFIVPALSGCSKTSVVTKSGDGEVEVLYSPPIERSYSELGLVTTQTGQTIFHDRSTEGMIAKLKEEAARLGADAIIVRSAEPGSWGLKGGGTTGFDRGQAQAIAIEYK